MQVLDQKENKTIFHKFGLGIEHFVKKSNDPKGLTRDENIKKILNTSYDIGIRHYDIVYNYPHFYEIFKEFLNNKKNKITFSTHLGQVYDEKTNTSKRSRSLKQIQQTIDYILEYLDINSIDTGILQYITNIKDFERIKETKILKFAYDLKEQGIIKSLGVSAHNQGLLQKIISVNDFDGVMFPINFSTGYLDSTTELINECKAKNIKIMAIKTLLHGKPFFTKKTRYANLMTCGNSMEIKLKERASPYQCFNYVFSSGADIIIFGVTNTDQLIFNLTNFVENRQLHNYENILNQFKTGKRIE